MEIAHRGVFAEAQVAAALQGAAAAAGEDDGEVIMAVTVGIADAAAKNDHAVVQQASVAFFDAFEFLEEVGKLFTVKFINFSNFFELFCIVLVMGDAVVAIRDADFGEAAVGAIVGEEEGGNTRGVCLEGEHLQVEHEADMLFVAVRDAGGFFIVRQSLGSAIGLGDAALDIPDGGEIFIELLLVGVAEVLLEGLGVLHHKIQHTLVEKFPAGPGRVDFRALAAAEETLEG